VLIIVLCKFIVSFLVQGCQDSGGDRRSTGQQNTAKFRISDQGNVTISYSNGTGDR